MQLRRMIAGTATYLRITRSSTWEDGSFGRSSVRVSGTRVPSQASLVTAAFYLYGVIVVASSCSVVLGATKFSGSHFILIAIAFIAYLAGVIYMRNEVKNVDAQEFDRWQSYFAEKRGPSVAQTPVA